MRRSPPRPTPKNRPTRPAATRATPTQRRVLCPSRYYVGSEAGIYRNAGGCRAGKWEPMFDRRIARRTGAVRDRVAHDFQAISGNLG